MTINNISDDTVISVSNYEFSLSYATRGTFTFDITYTDSTSVERVYTYTIEITETTNFIDSDGARNYLVDT
jgi:hypothetical protein